MIKKCCVCGKEFDAQGKHKTCSTECRAIMRRNWEKDYRERKGRAYNREWMREYRKERSGFEQAWVLKK
jgi:predicted nucleic acid-binding Zn ribbon protein